MNQRKIRAGEVPKLIRQTAEELTGEFYEQNRSDRFRRSAGTQKHFVRTYWKTNVDHAISALSMVLGQPGVPAESKAEIFEAIVQFNDRSTFQTPGLTLGRLM